MRFPFNEPENTAVISCVHVMKENKPILYVSRDFNEGMWQFLCGETHDTKDAMSVSLLSICEKDNTICQLAGLPPGHIAMRVSVDSKWMIYQKAEAKQEDYTGEAEILSSKNATAPVGRSNATTILAVAITLTVMGFFVFLIVSWPWIGLPLFIVFCLVLLIGALIKTRHKTVEKYIASQNSKLRPILQKIHETILETELCAAYGLDNALNFPFYFSFNERLLIAVQPIKLPYKGIALYPGHPEVFTAFADRLKEHKIANGEIYFLQNKPIDYGLIRDIVIFTNAKHTEI